MDSNNRSLNIKNHEKWWYLVNKILKNRDINNENKKDWEIVLNYFEEIKDYFSVMQYELKISKWDGFVYIEEYDWIEVESLSNKQPLSIWTTLFLVILREYIYQKESEDLYANKYIITQEHIEKELDYFLSLKYDNDKKRKIKTFEKMIENVLSLWIMSKINSNKITYKINRLIKVKMSVEQLKNIKEDLLKYLNKNEISNENDNDNEHNDYNINYNDKIENINWDDLCNWNKELIKEWKDLFVNEEINKDVINKDEKNNQTNIFEII